MIIQKNSHFRGAKWRVKANNNRKAVVVCARRVVMRPSKSSALVCKYIANDQDICKYFYILRESLITK